MIFFLHIPKTAGTSLCNSFQSLVGPSLLWYAEKRDLEHSLPKAPCDILGEPEARERFKVYGGHFGLRQIAPYLRPDDLLLSIVRDPVMRAYSFYNHVMVNDKKHPLRPMVLGLPIIEASMRSDAFLGQIQNNQCWFISGTKGFGPARDVIEQGRVKVFDLSEAQSLIDLTAQVLGVDAPIVPSLNLSKKPDYLAEMTEEERGFLQGVNIEDQKLYNYLLAGMRGAAAVDRRVEATGRAEAVVAQSGNEDHRLPKPEQRIGD